MTEALATPRRLFLLRHAESGGAQDDKSRTLTDRGCADARALGALMARQNFIPETVLCSAAVRTRQTWEHLKTGGGFDPAVSYLEPIYNAHRPEKLLEIIGNADPRARSLLLIGHNPVIYGLAAQLADQCDDSKTHDLITRLCSGGYPPATLSVFECPAMQSWADLSRTECRITGLFKTETYAPTPEPPER